MKQEFMRYPLMFIIPVVLIGAVACKKLQVQTQTSPITNGESAIMVAGSLASNSNGLVTLTNDASLSSQSLYNNAGGCGATHTDSVTHKNTSGPSTTCDFTYKITNKLNCNANKLPDNVSSNLSFSGHYNNMQMSAIGGGSTSVTVAGLTPTSAVYVINGTFKSITNFKLRPDTTRNGNIAVDITMKNLTISKATVNMPAMITGGTAVATITGNSPKGAFLFDGTIVFNGYNDATLTLGGTTYLINLTTGALSKK
jgi:hypothetical protein